MGSKRPRLSETEANGSLSTSTLTPAMLEMRMRERSGSRLDNISIDNVETKNALQWRPGALLDAAADAGALSVEEVSRIREKLNISKLTTKPPVTKSVPAVENQANSNSVQNIVRQVDSPPTKSGFLPPRRVRARIYNASRNSELSEQEDQPVTTSTSKQFTFKKKNGIGGDNSVTSVPSSVPSSTYQPSGGSLYSTVGSENSSIRLPPQDDPSVIQPNLVKNQQFTANNNVNPQEDTKPKLPVFRTALEQKIIDDREKGIYNNYKTNVSGLRKPTRSGSDMGRIARPANRNEEDKPASDNPELDEIMAHESMKNVDAKMVEAVLNEVVQITSTGWDDISGLEHVKVTIREIIILPMLRPDLFTGIRSPAKGILFFGPPGTGKTMFGRLIATESKSTFFNISASSLTSKWIGDGEKMVRALFAVARVKQPSVIFIDEIDSILTQRSDTEHESSRRLKTEFLIQFDGAATQNNERILVIGVTNRPQELDEAARRRLVKRIYIPLPDAIGRKQMVKNLMKQLSSQLEEADYDQIADLTVGYSGADMTSLCQEAALGPLRDVPADALADIHASQVRAIKIHDFVCAQKNVKSSVAESDVVLYEDWNSKFGCHS